MKVTIYGQVNRAIRFANTGDNTEITSVDNDGSSSRIGSPGGRQGQPEPDHRRPAPSSNGRQNHGAPAPVKKTRAAGPASDKLATCVARHVDLWLDHKDIGKLSMGHGSIAGDAAGLYELTGVSFVYGFAGANGTDGTLSDASVDVYSATGTTAVDAGNVSPNANL